MRAFAAPVLALLLLAGCNRGSQLMPLESGNTWTYDCTAGLVNRVATVRVSRPAPVGQASGWALVSELGTTTLAWQDGRLVTGQLGNSEFFPPLPIFSDQKPGTVSKWAGRVRTAGHTVPATATLKVSSSEESVDGKKMVLPTGQVELTAGGETHEIDTWFRLGKGIHLQEHRVGGQLVSRMRYVSGP